MQGGYSTSEEITYTFIKTSHLIAKLRVKLKENLDEPTVTAHKEITKMSSKQHGNMIAAMKI